ncbi:malate synthase G [Chromatiales bacterium (ex Bugula neritina AB1)]|nr:malate synthase G [Chromatiales bacterium (ex Bugula neritina AB1)]
MSTQDYISHGELEIAESLHKLLAEEICPGTGVEPEHFWSQLEGIVRDFSPRIKNHLAKRDDLQEQIDSWHRANRTFEPGAYKTHLQSIGYLEDEAAPFTVSTSNVDPEIASIAGAQLVVPLDNARFVLNAANARWGSLYDALYGTDAIPETDGATRAGGYNPVRGSRVVAYCREFLDTHFPLTNGSHADATAYRCVDGSLQVSLADSTAALKDAAQFKGYNGNAESPDNILLCKNSLHADLCFNADHPIGKTDSANLCDIILESAITTIMDCEDSVASVDVEDKVMVYRNWLGLMTGKLAHTFEKGGKKIDRKLAPDRSYTSASGDTITLPGRSVLLVRNVGTQLTIDAVKFGGEFVPETLIDAMVTSLCAKHDLLNRGEYRNSRSGSVYIVKPKMHGSDEVALASELFARVEQALSIEPNTLKMGIMDEERRTTVNLKSCINAARNRVVFINTGFLDRTGDDIHTCMEAGPMLPKAEIKQATWLMAYEDNNVDCGLACGLQDHAQIGKGMWAMPDEMAAMLETKIQHLQQGGNTAWVPSPTAATLHATHYFDINVRDRQNELKNRPAASVDDIITIPLLPAGRNLSAEEIQLELDNNCQGILGYVARWVGQGIGCSKVLDINNVALMEDCATLRISSQHIANWLHHGIISEEQVVEAMKRLAIYVDEQNQGDPDYSPMSTDFDASITFQASLDLAIKGRAQPNGYTEFILYDRRQQVKSN